MSRRDWPRARQRYQLKQILFQANPEPSSLPGGRARRRYARPGGIFARAQGVDMKIVATSARAAGKEWFSTITW